MNLNELVELVDNLKDKIQTPKTITNAYLLIVWVSGRNAGISKIRNHVRHHASEKFPIMDRIPRKLGQELGEEASKVWLEAYNAPIEYVEQRVQVMFFNATNGQALFNR